MRCRLIFDAAFASRLMATITVAEATIDCRAAFARPLHTLAAPAMSPEARLDFRQAPPSAVTLSCRLARRRLRALMPTYAG